MVETLRKTEYFQTTESSQEPNLAIVGLYQSMVDIAKSGPEGAKMINNLVTEPLLSARLARLEAGNQYTKGFKLVIPNGHQILDETPYAIGLASYLYENLMDMAARGKLLSEVMEITADLQIKLEPYKKREEVEIYGKL